MTTPSTEDILSGFQINWVAVRDVDTSEVLWLGNEDYSSSEKTQEIKIPKKILKSRAVYREINFSSIESWENLRLVQTFLYKGVIMDEWCFDFGWVPPNSSNSWQSVIEAAPEVKMIKTNILSGNVEVVTKFYNNEGLVTTSRVVVFYV